MTVSDKAKVVEGLGDFFKKIAKKGLNPSQKMVKFLLKNPGSALGITANGASAVASRNTKAVLSTLPELINFYHAGKGLHLRKYVKVFCLVK